MKLVVVVATRPNFVKAAPLMAALKGKADVVLVHTGQHYDYAMSQVFFEDLRLPAPDIDLGIGSGTHAQQVGWTMIEVEQVLTYQKPDAVIVFGDVNATLAAALAAAKLNIPVAHIEAGVRSYDDMPEEANRRVTDTLSKWLFTTSHYEDENLEREGLFEGKAYLVGNIMADTLLVNRCRHDGYLAKLGVRPNQYALATLHRAGNVDDEAGLRGLLGALAEVAKGIPLVFPVHPRTRKNLVSFGLDKMLPDVVETPPLGYLSTIDLEANASFVITDSGGVQVETTVLGVPCLTVLEHPVWPITHEVGTNKLVGTDPQKLVAEAYLLMNGKKRTGKVPDYWDGHTAERIVEVLTE